MQNAGGFAASLGREAPGAGIWVSLGVPAAGKAGARVPPAHRPGWTRAGWRLCGRGCCPQAGHRPCGPLAFPTPRCAPGRVGEPERNSFPSSATVLFPRVSQSPCGQSPLPSGSLRRLPPSRVLGSGTSPHMGQPAQPGHASPPAPMSPMGAQLEVGGERDTAPHPAGQAELQACSRTQRGWGENGSLSAETSRKAPWAP